ncbi:hypothetical protein ABK040_011102 [Willaertia magna]
MGNSQQKVNPPPTTTTTSEVTEEIKIEELLTPQQIFYFKDFQAHVNCNEKINEYVTQNKLIEITNEITNENLENKKIHYSKLNLLENVCVLCQNYEEDLFRKCFGNEIVEFSEMKESTSLQNNLQNNENKESLKVNFGKILNCLSNDEEINIFTEKIISYKHFLRQEGSFKELFPNLVNELQNNNNIVKDKENNELLNKITKENASKEFKILENCFLLQKPQLYKKGKSCFGEALIYAYSMIPFYCKTELLQCLQKKGKNLENSSIIDFSNCLTQRTQNNISCTNCFQQVMNYMNDTILKDEDESLKE